MSGENPKDPAPRLDLARLKKAAILRLGLSFPAFGLMFFLPAGTFAYWQAWVYMAILLILMTAMMIYLLRNNPEVLERRFRMKEKEKEQKRIVNFGAPLYAAGFLLPGFDRRFGWSSVPVAVVLAADLLILLGYFLFFLVIRENQFAGRTVEVVKSQKVITTGPYAVIRHPMYVAILAIFLSSAPALGSWWALIPFGLTSVIFPVRILNEEKVLLEQLEGYRSYTQRTRYRLIPGIW